MLSACPCFPWVWSTWVKTPMIRGADVLIVSACLPYVNRELFDRVREGKVVLMACPEKESSAYYGKIASIIRSCRPRSLTIVTVDGSPHCFALHASVNEAEYILGEKIEKKHYIVINGQHLVEISSNSVRVARYLHLVDELIKRSPDILKKLEELSLEYRKAMEIQRGSEAKG